MYMQWKCMLSLTHYFTIGKMDYCENGLKRIHTMDFPVEVRPLWFHVNGLREGVSEEVGACEDLYPNSQ